MDDAIIMSGVRLRLGLRDFRFDCALPKGRIIAVTGPSGSGKSTLLNLLAGFETAESGRIAFDGVDMTGRHPAERPVSLIFQDNNLFAHLDLFTNVGLGISPSMRLSTPDRERISEALVRVGLGGYEKRMPGTLSGGERQRAAFARALVRHRPVLLLDEPFAALDPSLRVDMAELLLDLHRETGNTVVIVSHDPKEVRRLADFAVFIDGGEIRLAAPLSEFLECRTLPSLRQFLDD
ncbi:thiamine ABC transporter ATP-binding protein [Rhizobium sp. RAF56]|jgi:thiamine transport system ATP-binding protein|uniref:thiamine ABC transporter ATP-binding protein n=1 Tax=Rhizobium sp. RAF56 TaxID=3233062 RepID=UPI003F99D4CE